MGRIDCIESCAQKSCYNRIQNVEINRFVLLNCIISCTKLLSPFGTLLRTYFFVNLLISEMHIRMCNRPGNQG